MWDSLHGQVVVVPLGPRRLARSGGDFPQRFSPDSIFLGG